MEHCIQRGFSLGSEETVLPVLVYSLRRSILKSQINKRKQKEPLLHILAKVAVGFHSWADKRAEKNKGEQKHTHTGLCRQQVCCADTVQGSDGSEKWSKRTWKWKWIFHAWYEMIRKEHAYFFRFLFNMKEKDIWLLFSLPPPCSWAGARQQGVLCTGERVSLL